MAQGYNPAALLPEVEAISIPEPADFVAVGEFNGDGRKDILVGARHGGLWLLAGDGHGVTSAEQIALPGNVTALAAGEFRAADGKGDAAVAIAGPGGSRLLVY